MIEIRELKCDDEGTYIARVMSKGVPFAEQRNQLTVFGKQHVPYPRFVHVCLILESSGINSGSRTTFRGRILSCLMFLLYAILTSVSSNRVYSWCDKTI